MARSKSRSGAGKKAAKTKKRRAAAKKASTTRKRRAAAKKAATTRKRRVAGKKAALTRKTRKVSVPRKAAAPKAQPSTASLEIDRRIAIVRNNLRDLMERAAATSGSASEDLLSDRIASEEAELQRLLQERDALT
jgi:hypothetical protein